MAEVSTKPYLIRAIYEWCADSGFTPYVAVAVDESVRVPAEFVKNGEIVLNISALATNRLKIGNEAIEFQARFGGVPREVYVPMQRVMAIYARENGQGMAFDTSKMLLPTGVQGGMPGVQPPGGPRLVPHQGEPAAQNASDDPPPPAPGSGPGDRPKLTRIK